MMITDTYAKSGEDFEVVDFDFFHWGFYAEVSNKIILKGFFKMLLFMSPIESINLNYHRVSYQ
jgi:hypothetical protein